MKATRNNNTAVLSLNSNFFFSSKSSMLFSFGGVRSYCFNRPLVSSFSTRQVSASDHETEEWIDMSGFLRYQISSLGNIRSKKTNKLLKINYETLKKFNRGCQVNIRTNEGKQKNAFVSRLVLMSFAPMDNVDKLFAIHLDGNRYNNQLENLKWSNKIISHRSKVFNTSPIRLQSNNNEIIEFNTANECVAYLSKLSIDVSFVSVSQWCWKKQYKHGYYFMFQNPEKYQYQVQDKYNEVWKMFHSTKQNHYFVSSLGRIKSKVIRTSREQLISRYVKGGYYLAQIQYNGRKGHLVHRLVADNFVANPHNYNMVDHLNSDVSNNEASNLRWVKNQKHNHDNEQSRKNKSIDIKVEQISLIDGSVICVWDRASVADRALGFRSGPILSVCRKQQKTAYGFQWRFVSDGEE
eukprot:310252_1